MRFRDSNIETAQLVNPPLEYDGVLADADRQRARHLVELRVRERPRDRPGHPRRADRPGRRHARPRAHRARRCIRSRWSSACCRCRAAREIGLPESWTQRLAQHSADAPPGAHRGAHWWAARRPPQLLQPGDLLLAIDGNVVTRFREVEKRRRRQGSGEGHGLARRRRADARGADRGAAGHGRRSPGAVGRGDAAGAAPRHERAARHRPGGRVRRLLRATARRRRATGCTRGGASSRSMACRRRTWMPSSRS